MSNDKWTFPQNCLNFSGHCTTKPFNCVQKCFKMCEKATMRRFKFITALWKQISSTLLLPLTCEWGVGSGSMAKFIERYTPSVVHEVMKKLLLQDIKRTHKNHEWYSLVLITATRKPYKTRKYFSHWKYQLTNTYLPVRLSSENINHEIMKLFRLCQLLSAKKGKNLSLSAKNRMERKE